MGAASRRRATSGPTISSTGRSCGALPLEVFAYLTLGAAKLEPVRITTNAIGVSSLNLFNTRLCRSGAAKFRKSIRSIPSFAWRESCGAICGWSGQKGWAALLFGRSVDRRRQLLFLAHRIPYPPDKGDKIRSFHILQYLSQLFEIRLGCFSDQGLELQHIENLRTFCKEVFCLSIG